LAQTVFCTLHLPRCLLVSSFGVNQVFEKLSVQIFAIIKAQEEGTTMSSIHSPSNKKKFDSEIPVEERDERVLSVGEARKILPTFTKPNKNLMSFHFSPLLSPLLWRSFSLCLDTPT
jgi:hypothetical protein